MLDLSRTATALRHVHFEDLGLIAPLLQKNGFRISYVEAPTADLKDPRVVNTDLLVVLGGPIGVYEIDSFPFLSHEIALIERRLATGKPTIGICLGCQLIATALGGRVFLGPQKEIGWSAVKLTDSGATSCLRPLSDPTTNVLHWHGDTFDLPQGADLLASSGQYENQAFSYGKDALALQFHLEADRERLEFWYVGHAAELAAAEVSVSYLREEARKNAHRTKLCAEQVFGRWLKQLR